MDILTLPRLERPAAKPRRLSPTLQRFGRPLLATAVIALVALGCIFRLWKLGNLPGVNGDEAWYGVQAMEWLAGRPLAATTPTGNPVNVFFLLPEIALHVFLQPSFSVLRLPAAISGLAALVVNFWLCGRVFGNQTAVVSTVALAVLPIDIAYSRFAWDASQSLLATVLVLYVPLVWLTVAARRRFAVLALAAFGAAVLVHPTNLFAAPLVAAPFWFRYRRYFGQRIRGFLPPGVGISRGVAMALACAISGWLLWPYVGRMFARAVLPTNVIDFATRFVELFSGATTYRYITGSDRGLATLGAMRYLIALGDAVTCAALLVAAAGFWRLCRSQRSDQDRCLALGGLTTVVLFYVFAGPAALAPHFERYAICLVAPTVLMVSRGVSWWLDGNRTLARSWAWSAVAAVLLASFAANYFWFLERTGGESHFTFRTAATEPKLAAFHYVLRERTSGRPVWIVARQWWNYWPLKYLAGAHDDVHVVESLAAVQPQSPDALRSDDTWSIEFSGTPDEQQAVEQHRQGARAPRRIVFTDYGGKDVLTIIGPPEKISQNY